ncbi:MAG: Rrf2 family transcriptional regulator [Phycisphaeraceae bacterium]|nr:Rrf2 family transcriptional regulator [Phycisphaeraceae bacterium]MBX3367626.1 Rrf2 family transcriptional regulator [Phycisphaeraceae bacterium]QYK47693.1 MAG: Rrf2 family transcriptional regulator [Phycisphaeraceae bacterium]
MFSQTTEYALRAMALLAYYPDQLVPTPTLAEETKVPPTYLAKVLQQLSGADLITGRRGVGGGYKLNRAPEQINLLDVINAVAPIRRITTCPLGLADHGSNLCPLHRRMDNAAKVIIELFEGVTLADLVNQREGSRPLCDKAKAAKLTVSISKK